MTEQELRALVRGVIAEVRLKADATGPVSPPSAGPAGSWHPASAEPAGAWRPALAGPPDPTVVPLASIRQHASHGLFVIPAQGEACLIEPGVACTHCGYCKSYGH